MFKPLFTGISLPCGNDQVVLSCSFASFLADLMAHKKILCCTGGAVARRPCWSCVNLAVRHDGNYLDHEITLSCADRSKFICYTDDGLWRMIDRMHAIDPSIATKTKLASLVTDTGFHIQPSSLLCDVSLVRCMGDISRKHVLCFADFVMCYIGGYARTHGRCVCF